MFLFITIAAGIVFVGSGALAGQKIMSGVGWLGIAKQSRNAQQFMGATVTEELLPKNLAGWQRIGHEATADARTSTANVSGNMWTYSNGVQTFSLTLVGAYRGAFPAEMALRNGGYKVKSMGQAFRFVRPNAEGAAVDPNVADTNSNPSDAWCEYREFIANDPVYGEAYVAYASIAVPPQVKKPSVEIAIIEALPLQPTALSLRLTALGTEGLREEDRQAFQNVLQLAVQEIQGKLSALP